MALSLTWPLNLDYDGFQSYTDEEITQAIHQTLKMLLLTRKGEYPMDNNFGVGMTNYLFEQNSIGLISNINSEVRKQIRIYMPYVVIKKLEFNAEDIDKNQLSMRLEYSISQSTLNEVFEMEFTPDSFNFWCANYLNFREDWICQN